MPDQAIQTSAGPGATLGAGAVPPSVAFTMEDIPALFKDPEFTGARHEDRSAMLETVINGAYRDAAQNGMTPEDHVAFGDLVQKAREKNEASLGEKTADTLRGVGTALSGLAQGVGALAYETSPPRMGYNLLTGHPEKIIESVKTIGGASLNALTGRAGNYDELIRNDASPEGRALDSGLDDMFARIDKGEHLKDPGAWLRSQSDKIKPLQQEYHAVPITGSNAGIEFNGVQSPEQIRADREQHAADAQKITRANALTNPENVALLATYMATRNPKAKAQLKANLLRTGMAAAAAKDREAILHSPGAQEFERTFGKGSAEHLIAGSDPVNAAMLALPMLRGAGAIGETASALSKAATFVGEQTAFGIDSAIQKNPSDPDYVEGVTDMLALGGVMHGGGRILKMATGKGKTEEVTPTAESEAKPAAPSTDAVAADLFNNTGREGASDAEFAALDSHVQASQGAKPEPPPVQASAPVEPVTPPEPPAQLIPEPLSFRTFDENGRLKAKKEAPHAEALKEIRGRESMLQKILDCLTKKLAA